MERERSRKSHSSALNPGTAYFKILMRKGKVQVFRIRRIMLILEKLKDDYSYNGDYQSNVPLLLEVLTELYYLEHGLII
ncbi:hypothetical protein [Acinetobacter oleivorans]|uniref:hypothetical protein n=1 Tax=Acinetobacter oleivorans TaxID=1148157 RepID=UPI003A8BA4ED